MKLSKKSRGRLELCTPAIVDETEDTLFLTCLDTFNLWALKEDVSVTPSLRDHGFWESWITSWFTHHIDEGDFVVDIGANCGYFTMLFEHLSGDSGRVVAYEASRRYADLLKQTKADTGSRFVVENLAVSDAPGHLTLTYPGEYTGSASVIGTAFNEKWGEEHHETVEATTLDIEFDGVDSPQLIKIDAESAEELIWNGAQSLLTRHDAPVVVLEYSPTGAYSKGFDAVLFDYGTVTRISHDGIEEPITPKYLQGLTDWEMIVIRRNNG